MSETTDFRPIYYDAFISYKRKGGSVWGELLRTVLTYKMGLRVWFDVFDITGGKWKDQVKEAIPKSLYVIAIFYKGWEDHLENKISNDEFLYELKLASTNNCKIIPFFAQDYSSEELLQSDKVPKWLKKLFNGPNSHNSIVKYCHTTIGETYKKLQQQLVETKLILRLNLATPDCKILSINVDDSEISKETVPINGGYVSLDRHFKGVVKVIYQKMIGENKGETVTIRIGIRKHKEMFSDSEVCDAYWKESEIDMDIDEPRNVAKPLYHDYTFDWDTYQNELRRHSNLYKLGSKIDIYDSNLFT